MRQLRLLQLTLLIMLGCGKSFSQDTKIDLELWMENEIIELDRNSSIRIISGSETIMLPVKEGSFIVSDSLKKSDLKIIFNLNGNELAYESIPFAWNPLHPNWTIKVDSQPFSDENKYLLKKPEKKPQLIYIFDNGTGSTFTGYKYERLNDPK